ncbi:glycoside hydrolase family 1 protein [Rahnella inusitata]|uniref:glycoside hydrolase family 1 protein n=1 Tax=Rahnella inusitata TaxID=58169 RepID=UPI0039BDA646
MHHDKKFLKFPEGFWWGSAWSAEQAEGKGNTGKGRTQWDMSWDKEPNRFYRGVNTETATDFFHRYPQDIQLMKETGHNSFRLSISWARLFPEGDGDVSQEAIAFYRDMLNQMNASGIKPFANLFHFDMPERMMQKGGWESREVVDAYVRFADTCFAAFGDLVFHWFTFNEPLGPVLGGYMEDFHYPNVVDFKRGVQVAFNTVLASARAIEVFKRHGLGSKIGIILNLSPTYPRSENGFDKQAAEYADLFYNRSFLDPSVKGTFPQKLTDTLKLYGHLPTYTPEDLAVIRDNTVQILGLNYYEPRRVKARTAAVDPQSPFMPEWFFESYVMPGRRFNPHRGWEIYEKGIYDLCIDIRDNYGNIDAFISENGMGVADEERFMQNGQVQDIYRIGYIKNHLAYVHQAIGEGCNINGYHLWTFIDCWSWINAYKNRYGLVALDLNSQQRTVKLSGEFYKKLSDENGFEFDGFYTEF